MEKRVNRTWLFLLLLAVVVVAVLLWFYTGRTTGSYSGGILIELPKSPAGQQMMASGDWL